MTDGMTQSTKSDADAAAEKPATVPFTHEDAQNLQAPGAVAEPQPVAAGDLPGCAPLPQTASAPASDITGEESNARAAVSQAMSYGKWLVMAVYVDEAQPPESRMKMSLSRNELAPNDCLRALAHLSAMVIKKK